MIQLILLEALEILDLKLCVTTALFHIFSAFKQHEEALQSFDFVFTVSIEFALIPCVIVSYILQEREDNLEYIQLIARMSLVRF